MLNKTLLLLSIFFLFIGLQVVELNAADAKTNYESKCANCHAKDGSGIENPKLLKILGVDRSKLDLLDDGVIKKTDSELLKIISSGIDDSKMKSYKDKFSKKEIEELVEYIRSLKK